jgi:gliding motility-associated-like protein
MNGPLPVINILSPGNFCNGQTATLTASGATSYSWTDGTSGPVLTTTNSGIYTAVGTNSCGTSTNTFDVVFSLPPSVSVTASQYTICPNQTTTLTALGINGGTDYSWFDFPANSGSTQTVSSGGNYLVTYTNSCGTSTAIVQVTQSTVSAGFTFNPPGGNAPLLVDLTNTSSNYTLSAWDFGNGQTSSATNANGVSYPAAGTYTITLTVQNTDGCTSTVSQVIEVTPGEFGPVPEAFTPNGDNNNDLFKINGIERYPSAELLIYNRWGSLVYSMKGYNNSNAWDGKANANGKSGGKLPTGTYFYLLNLNDEGGQVFRGFVELMY